jgi:hypothetical protein
MNKHCLLKKTMLFDPKSFSRRHLMPAYYGLRSRPSTAPVRGGAVQFVSSQGFMEAFPRLALLPLALIALFAIFSATSWVNELSEVEQVTGIEVPATTGTISIR